MDKQQSIPTANYTLDLTQSIGGRPVFVGNNNIFKLPQVLTKKSEGCNECKFTETQPSWGNQQY